MTNEMHRIFAQWPESIPRKGAVLTSFGEQIPFSDYLLNGSLLLLCRAQPDAQGTRRSILHMDDVKALKFQDALDPDRFVAMGFERPAPRAGNGRAGSAGTAGTAPVIRGPV